MVDPRYPDSVMALGGGVESDGPVIQSIALYTAY